MSAPTPGCVDCGRDNDNGTHTALEQTGHLSHPYNPRITELTFRELTEKSLSRRNRWHHADTIPWTGADWSNAMCGEAGEAANIVKKLRRHETGMPDVLTETELRQKLADELGDVVAYLVLLANHYDIDLGVAVAQKFNRVSHREGYPEQLTVPEARS